MTDRQLVFVQRDWGRMRVAALYDIHGNLPALEAVLEEMRQEEVDHIVIGGDVVPGPMPRETLACLMSLARPMLFIHGNGELAVMAQLTAAEPDAVTYWGTTSGEPLPEPLQEALRWTAQQLRSEDGHRLSSWPRTQRLEIEGLGRVLFCHATPRSEVECFTRLTPEPLLRPVFEGLDADLVVCGHTHMPFDRRIGRVRVANAGSVGMPFGEPGADWVLLGPDVRFRHTTYDLPSAADRIRATSYPQAEEFAARYVLEPPSEVDMLPVFTHASFE